MAALQPQPSATTRNAPLRFGPYVLTERLGKGGMAEVYRAKRRGPSGFEKQVVVKSILPHLANDRRFVRMFKEEARLSAQLIHNNIVQVHDFGLVGTTPFLELELVTGRDLGRLWTEVVVRGGLAVGVALTIATEACRGLAYAHSFVDEQGVHRPVIHRDVSPSNIIICRDGTVKLLDFGLASVTNGETLEISTFHGKLAYMSPEQLERRQVDRRADVFALGAILYELLTGQRLFQGATDLETLWNIRAKVIERPSALNPSVPAAVDVVVLRALARDPDERYGSAAELLAALENLPTPAAARRELLRALGQMDPEIFSVACDACGQRLPSGTECPNCRTQIDESAELVAAVPSVALSPATTAELKSSPRSRASTVLPAVSRSLASARLAFLALLAQLAAWARVTRPRVRAFVEASSVRTQAASRRSLRWVRGRSTRVAAAVRARVASLRQPRA